MTTDTLTQPAIDIIQINKAVDIAAPVEIAWESLLEELGPEAHMMDGKPMPFKLETWPGGRWFRDLGNNTGHLWGHVQVIKPPSLLEIWGPMMMSFPAINHLQYRLTADGSSTHMTLLHRSLGPVPQEFRDGMPKGWAYWLDRIRQRAEKNKKQSKK